MCTFEYTIKLIYRLNLMNYYRIKYLIEYIEKAYLNALRCYFLNQLEKKIKNKKCKFLIYNIKHNRSLIEFTLRHQLNAYLLWVISNYFPISFFNRMTMLRFYFILLDTFLLISFIWKYLHINLYILLYL